MVDAVNALTEGDAEPIERAISRGPNKPATGVMWWSWARFANWLNTSTGNHPAFAGIGNTVADALIAYFEKDGANQAGDWPGGDGKPYADWTGYECANTADVCNDPSRWQPKWFVLPNGERFAPGGLTPQWGRVKTIAIESGDQFRPGPPPGLDDPRMKEEVDEVIRYNASLTPRQKAIVEFMRDGPRSTGQSGHWLRFAADVSRRDKHDLDQDVKTVLRRRGRLPRHVHRLLGRQVRVRQPAAAGTGEVLLQGPDDPGMEGLRRGRRQ